VLQHARRGRPSGIVAKMNSLVDEDVVEALYRASQAGVPISLIVRGICCLRPGVPGVSENIAVRAIIDRYLEHGRIMHFVNAGKNESSADWLPRNFHRRVEVMVPIDDPRGDAARPRAAAVHRAHARQGEGRRSGRPSLEPVPHDADRAAPAARGQAAARPAAPLTQVRPSRLKRCPSWTPLACARHFGVQV
jgi:polyphosphate kinase